MSAYNIHCIGMAVKQAAATVSIIKNNVIFYEQKSGKDVGNFDREFTNEPPVNDTPTDKLLLMNVDANLFADFSFVNPEFIVVV